jgi:aspartate/methionine/tyrosine aminotransferase
MDIIQQLRGSHWVDASERLRLVNLAIAEIERLRSQMDLFDPSTTQEMAAATLNFANDAIGQLQERNHALRKANKRLGEIATDMVGWIPPASVNGPREEYQNEIKELTE